MTDEWYTPAHIIEAAREVMGSIDLDPASCAMANDVVGATTYYSEIDNGILQPWLGNVWCNPPYSIEVRRSFVDRVVGAMITGEINQCCLFLNNNTAVTVEQVALDRCQAVCFPKGRTKFWNELGVGRAPRFGGMVMYYGSNVSKFTEVFGRMGVVMQR